MGKKAKNKRIERYKAFLNGMITYKEKFAKAKVELIEKLLTDDSFKETLIKKDRKEMTKIERAAVDTITTRDLKNVEAFEEIKESLIEDKVKKAKFKYHPKEI